MLEVGEPAVEVGDVIPEVLERVTAGERLKDVCRDVSARTGIPVKRLYDTAVGRRD